MTHAIEVMSPEMQEALELFNAKQEIIKKVRGVFPGTNFPDIETQFLAHYQRGTQLSEATLLPQKSILVGSFEGDTIQHPYGIVSPQYKLVTHEEMIYNVLDSIKEHAIDWGKPKVNIVLWNQGARMKFNIDFPNFKSVQVAIGDPVSLRFAGTNSYDLGLEYKVAVEALVLKCENGMVGTDVLEKYNCRHKANLDVNMTRTVMVESAKAFMIQTKIWNSWSQKPLSIESFQPVFDGLPFGERHRKEILELPIVQHAKPLQALAAEGAATLWDTNLAVTQFLTHNVESEMVKMKKGAEVSKYLHDVGHEMAA